MFHIVKLSDNVRIKSEKIDRNIIKNIEIELKNSYENKILGRIDGFVISIFKINNDIKTGTINDMNGDVNYKIDYFASVFVPRIKKTLDIIVYLNDGDIYGYPYLVPNSKNSILCLCKKDLEPDLDPVQGTKKITKYDETIEEDTVKTMYIVNIEIKYQKITIIGYLL